MRTDLTCICEACRLRLRSGHQTCPRCGTAELLDSTYWNERRKNPPKPRPKMRGDDGTATFFAVLVYASLAVLVLGGAVAANVHMLMTDVEMTTAMIVVVVVIASVLGAAGGGVAWLVLFMALFVIMLLYDWIRDLVVTPSDALPVTVEPEVEEPDAAPAVTGTVEAYEADGGPGAKLLTAPVSEASCVAYGLTGQCSRDEVDDGEMVSFFVVPEEGERVLVEPPPALVGLTAWEPAPVGGDAAWERLDALLMPRGIDTEAGCAELREACLRVGDRVSVWGQVEEQADPRGEARGFRGTPTIKVVRDATGAGLVVRQQESGDQG